MSKEHSVTVYSTPSCPYCVMAKDYFKKHGVMYRDVDVSTNREAAQEMIQKSGQMGVPVIDIDGEILVGFQPQVFQSLLGIGN